MTIIIIPGPESMITQIRNMGVDVRKWERELEEPAFKQVYAPPNRRKYEHEHQLNERNRKAHS